MAKLSKKERLARLLTQPIFEQLLLKRKLNRLSLLAYHSIQPEMTKYPFNAEIISAFPDVFEKQLAFLKRHFNVINFAQLAELSQDNGRYLASDLPPNSLILTFDDGYADNLHVAAPMLKAHDLTAVVYVATDYIDNGAIFWFDELAYLMKRMPTGPLNLGGGLFRIDVKSQDRERERRALGQFLQTVNDSERIKILEEFRTHSTVVVQQDDLPLAKPLTWSEVQKLTECGIEIGSHTMSHGFLDSMSSEEIKLQVIGSKARIEEVLSRPVLSFSYPNGNFNTRVRQAVVDAGYRFAVSYQHGVCTRFEQDQFLLPRLHVETDVSMSLFKANLLLPELFAR